MNFNLRSSSFDIISCLLPVECFILIRSRLRLKDDHNKLLWVTKISKITKSKAQHGIHSTVLTGRKCFAGTAKRKSNFIQ